MEDGYAKADSTNLSNIDALMVARFFALNSDFNATEFRNVKTFASSRQSYGDDAIGYVQLRRISNICTIKCKVCPEHRVRSKSYAATMVIDEVENEILSVQCHDCAASRGGCKHAVAFLMWVHRRSEEPAPTSVTCYWKKSRLAQVGSSLRYITSEDLSKVVPSYTQPDTQPDLLFKEFIKEAKNKQINSCLILKYQPDFQVPEVRKLSLHFLINKYGDNHCNTFLSNISQIFTKKNIDTLEENTRDQNASDLWHEMRYGRITGSIAHSVSRCKTVDGSLMATIMGARIPETKAMKRGRVLEAEVKKVVSTQLGMKINQCGLMISPDYTYIAATPDGICDKKIVVEVKCPTSEKTLKNYIYNNNIADKYMCQVQLQMFVSNLKKCYFCVAHFDFESSGIVHLIAVDYDEDFVKDLINKLSSFWIHNVFPILYGTTK